MGGVAAYLRLTDWLVQARTFARLRFVPSTHACSPNTTYVRCKVKGTRFTSPRHDVPFVAGPEFWSKVGYFEDFYIRNYYFFKYRRVETITNLIYLYNRIRKVTKKRNYKQKIKYPIIHKTITIVSIIWR